MTQEEKVWLIIRAVGLNALVFGVIETTYVAQDGIRYFLLAHGTELASSGYRWLFTWATIRLAAHIAIGLYLLFRGAAVHALVLSAFRSRVAAEAGAPKSI